MATTVVQHLALSEGQPYFGSTQNQPTQSITSPLALKRDVLAELHYHKENEDGSPPHPTYVDKPETYNRPFETHQVKIRDVSGDEEKYTLDQHGFQIHRQQSAEKHFLDDVQIKSGYYEEVEQLLKSVTGANRIFIFDHTIRRQPPSAATQDRVSRGPVQRVHIDQSYKAALSRVPHHLPEDAEELLKGRVQIINVWRPIKTVQRDPLAVAEAGSVRRLFWWALRYFLISAVIFVALLVPTIVLSNDAEFADDSTIESIQAKQYTNLVFYICLWLMVTWIAAVGSDLIGLGLPYFFRLIARYTNPSHQKYWRAFKFMRRPIAFLGTTLVTYIFFAACIVDNNLLAVNINKPADAFWWDDVVADVFQQLILWVCFYFIEKIFITYITIHYHYRGDNVKLTRTRELQNALITLYDASVYLHPPHRTLFAREDMLIRNAKGDAHASGRTRVSSYLARMGIDGYKMTSLFGNFISDDPNAHWLRPASTYAVIERAWASPVSAEALARRIWLPLVAEGKSGLTANDIIDVLGPYRKEEAIRIFKTVNENNSPDIRIEEFIGIVTEGGKTRHNIYRNMTNMDHCINTFDWFLLLILAAVMIFFIMVAYVPAIKQIQTILSSLAIGLSFAVGRTFHHLLVGIVFVFFDHPYDVGDVVNVYNPGSTVGTQCVVKRQSLLYTVFRRLDNGCDLQISNDRLSQKRIENFSRSGINRQGISMFVDFRTSFKDIIRLRTIMEEFLSNNSRDFVPESLGLNVVSLHELNKMELRLAFTHRNNWSDDKLRSQRSNRFHCALVAACRAIPLSKPGGMLPSAGENGNPMYTVQLNTTTELGENIKKEKDRRQGLRWDDVKSELHGSIDPSMSEEEATRSRLAAEAEKMRLAKVTEEEAFLKLARLPMPSTEAGASSAVDVPGSATGLRQTRAGK
ncbi:mechanosensitive ion channel [Colletotrichum gloeosporioides Cg-14]|uniref:Mechanosensitive ion channel n=1 Tax=Colletotrichum gloeosporioides (strain Cg-14) TaxID=1237896 RepID=T0KF37_COLGC|nr:mechanosensitive ion channel [Colletotrichum gloeosporioides Cg-14]